MVKYDLLHLLVYFLLLPEDNVTLPFNRRVLEFGVLQDVTDDVHRLSDVLAEALRVVHGLLSRSVRVKMRTKVLYLELEGVLAAIVGALERHVLKEMSCSVRLVRLRTRTGIYPYTNSRCLCMRVYLRRDCEAIREGSELCGRTVHHRSERPQWPKRPLKQARQF